MNKIIVNWMYPRSLTTVHRLLFSNYSLTLALQAREVIALDNTLAVTVGTGFQRFFYLHQTFSATDHTNQALVAMDAGSVAKSAPDGRRRDSHLFTAATDLADRELGQKFKRVDPLSLAKGACGSDLPLFSL